MRVPIILKSILFIPVLIIISGFLSGNNLISAETTEAGWHRLTDEALDHYYYGRKQEAISVAREALKSAEELFGPDDLKVVGPVDDLATYLASTGQYEEADKLYQRAFAILEKRLDPSDRYLAIFMDYLALFYDKIGRKEYAQSLKKRANDIRMNKNFVGVK